MATWKGLEPSTSSVTGWHSNQLNYQAAIFNIGTFLLSRKDLPDKKRCVTFLIEWKL